MLTKNADTLQVLVLELKNSVAERTTPFTVWIELEFSRPAEIWITISNPNMP